jgi:hypothetical protein
MTLPSWLLVSVGGRCSQRPGPSPRLGPLGPSHHRRHKSRVSLQYPPCAHGILDIPFGEVHDSRRVGPLCTNLGVRGFGELTISMAECEGLALVTLAKIKKWPSEVRGAGEDCDSLRMWFFQSKLTNMNNFSGSYGIRCLFNFNIIDASANPPPNDQLQRSGYYLQRSSY